MLKLFRWQESPNQHEGRQSLAGKGNRRGLVSPTPRKTPRWRNQKRKDLSRSFRALLARVRHHDAGPTKQALCRWPTLAIERSLGPILRATRYLRDHRR